MAKRKQHERQPSNLERARYRFRCYVENFAGYAGAAELIAKYSELQAVHLTAPDSNEITRFSDEMLCEYALSNLVGGH